jgi:L-fuconate dehydratase
VVGLESHSLLPFSHSSSSLLLHRIGPEKGVIHIASGAVNNALWDMYARSVNKPLWKLVVDFTPEEFVRSCAWRYISDAITKEEALELLKKNESTKKEREEIARKVGYPAYVTSAGWLGRYFSLLDTHGADCFTLVGYSDEKVANLTLQAVKQGFNHFKMKVGANLESDIRRGNIIRSIIDDPKHYDAAVNPARDPNSEGLRGKNAGPTGAVLMIDANQVWDVEQAIDYVKRLKEIKPWWVLALSFDVTPDFDDTLVTSRFIEEPTAPDDILGHARIRKELSEVGIGVATGEHAHSRIVFKQLLQANAIDVCQIDSCRLAGVSEVLSVLLMSKK